MDKKHMFSIGKLSKLTRVHIQSLRYYEELGILKPAYVDPQSQYRYYTFSHMRIVEAIQYCAMLGIPLKQFSNFLLEKYEQIDYAKLVEYGMDLTSKKISELNRNFDFLKNVQKELIHAENCCIENSVTNHFSEKLCYAIPYQKPQTDTSFPDAVCKLISDAEKNGLKTGHNYGQLSFYNEYGIESYIFIDIINTDKSIEKLSNIVSIPSGNYMCKISEESNILKAPEIFPDLFSQNYDKVIVEVELFSEKFNYSSPVFEIRCSLPQI